MIINPLGRYQNAYQTAFSYSAFTFTAASQYVIQIFTAEEDMTITQFGMCVAGSSGTPPIRIAMYQYVKGLSIPNPPTTKTYTDANPVSTPSGITTPTFTWWNLTTPQTIVRGTTYAIGIESYGTWSGSLTVVQNQDQSKRDYTLISGQPFSRTSSTNDQYSFRWGIASATKSYGYPVQTSGAENIGSFSTNTFSGNSFIIPTSMGASFTLEGILTPIAQNANFVNATLRLYNATSYPPTLITSRTLSDGGVPSSLNAFYQGQGGQTYIPFTTSQLLTTGVKYLVGIQNSGDAFSIGKFTYARAQDANCLSDVQTFGVNGDITANTWTESGTIRYVIGLDISSFTQGTGPTPPSTLTAAPRYTINTGIN